MTLCNPTLRVCNDSAYRLTPAACMHWIPTTIHALQAQAKANLPTALKNFMWTKRWCLKTLQDLFKCQERKICHALCPVMGSPATATRTPLLKHSGKIQCTCITTTDTNRFETLMDNVETPGHVHSVIFVTCGLSNVCSAKGNVLLRALNLGYLKCIGLHWLCRPGRHTSSALFLAQLSQLMSGDEGHRLPRPLRWVFLDA